MELKQVLGQLDPEDDKHWTANGDPRVDVVSKLAGWEVTRQEITDAAPGFTRENPKLGDEQAADQGEQGGDQGEQAAAQGGQGDAQASDVAEAEGTDEHLNDDQKEQARLRAERDELSRTRDGVRVQIAALREQDAQLTRGMDALTVKIDARNPQTSSMQEILRYQRKQNEIRLERAQRTQRVLAGLRSQDLRTAAPIDDAMKRRPERGTQRPSVPPVGSQT